MKKHKPLDFLAYILVAFLILLAVVINPNSINPTSYVAAGHPVGTGIEKVSYGAYNLGTWIEKFFGTKNAVFPKGACAQVAEELLNDKLNDIVVVTEGFSSTGPQRISTVMFGIEQDFIGALDMIYGDDLVAREGSDVLLDLWVEAIVRLPKTTKTTHLSIFLFGKKEGNVIHIQEGEVSTPISKCNFDITEGEYKSTCEVGRTHEYPSE